MSDILGPAAAASILDALLPSLEASLQAAQGLGAVEQMKAIGTVKRRLSDFADSTRAQNLADAAEVQAVREIDELVLEVISRLTVQQVSIGIAALQDGAARLRELTAALDLQTTVITGAAKSIALQPVKKALDTMTAMVGSVKALKANLKTADPDEAQAIAEIDRFIEQFEVLRRTVTSGDA